MTVHNPRVVGKLLEWYGNAKQFVTECIGAKPTSQQLEALELLPRTKRLTIRSGHGTGKDAFAAWAILWFLTTRPYSKVPCTAPTKHQLRNVLWSEVHKWLRQSRVKDEFVWNTERIYHKHAKEEHWAAALSINVKAGAEDQAETLAGLHADHQLIICDESSGIPDPVFQPLEGALTGEDNLVIMIGNMTRNRGYFYDTHYHPVLSKLWDKLHWNSEKSTNVAKSYITYMRIKYGEDSNVYRIRVLGEAPLEDTDALVVIPYHWAKQCIGNEMERIEDEPKYLGVDVARYGDDESIVMPRQGLIIDPYYIKKGLNTIDLAGFVNQVFVDEEAEAIAIDEIGVGAGVVDWLQKRHQGMNTIFGVNVASKSFKLQPDGQPMFHRLRDELWWAVRDKCMRQQYCFPNGDQGEELASELATPHYEVNETNGAIKVESKKHMRVVRQIQSPDRAEALLMTEYFHSTAHKTFGKGRTRHPKPRQYQESDHAWMTV